MGRGGTSLLWSSGETEGRAVFGFVGCVDSAAKIIEVESEGIGDCVEVGVNTSDVASMVLANFRIYIRRACTCIGTLRSWSKL